MNTRQLFFAGAALGLVALATPASAMTIGPISPSVMSQETGVVPVHYRRYYRSRAFYGPRYGYRSYGGYGRQYGYGGGYDRGYGYGDGYNRGYGYGGGYGRGYGYGGGPSFGFSFGGF